MNEKNTHAHVVNGLEHTVIASYEWKIDKKQKLNLGLGAHYNKYSSNALTFYNAPDPRPDYYRYVPSGVYMDDEILAEYKQDSYDKLVYQWHTNSSVSQLDLDRLYQANYKNHALYPDATAKYALEERPSNLFAPTFTANYYCHPL